MILFSLGLPILTWTFLKVSKDKPRLARRLLISIIAICVLDASIQFAGAVGTLNQYHAQRVVADYLRDHFDSKSNARIFCDDGTVRVLSGISEERFVTSANAPKDRQLFLNFLDQNNVEYLVLIKRGGSPPSRMFSDAEPSEPESLDLIMQSYTDFLPTDIWLYRVKRSGAVARP